MKRLWAIAGMSLLVLSAAQASILTNTNQSAEYIRMLSRNASLGIDAVYYNPAGLTELENGFHFSLNNQSAFQKKTIISKFPGMNESTFVGDVSAPIFPSAFLVYKMDKLAFSFGFGPNSGGGSADFSKGLPSFEWQLATVPFLMTALGYPTTAYRADVAFKGTSVFFGYQLNAAYAVTDWMSVALGGRLLTCSNTYEGSISGMMVYMPAYGQYIPLLQSMIPLPGLPDLQDTQVKAEQTGTGFTPVVGFNFLPMDGLNVSLRYEFKTKVELTNKTERDDLGMFPDGEKSRSDLPAMFSLGVGYALMPELRAMLSFNHWCDKNIDWDGDYSDLDKVNLKSNSWDLGLGVEYDLSDDLLVSAGFLRTQMTPGDDYQSDLRHELSSSSIGLGARYKLSDKFEVNLGGVYSFFDDYTEDVNYVLQAGPLTFPLGAYPSTYQRTSWALAIGFTGRF